MTSRDDVSAAVAESDRTQQNAQLPRVVKMKSFLRHSSPYPFVRIHYDHPLRQLPSYFAAVISIFLLSSSFPRLFSAVGDWMSTILEHMMRP